jgi:hypothetical protein
MNRVVNSTLLTLVLLIPAGVSAQSDVGVYVTGPDLQTKELEFKVVEGQRVKSSFQVKPESVVQVAEGGNLLVVTEPRNNVDNVKITDGSGKITELVNTNSDTFSLSGIPPGVYTLDVIANLPISDSRAAYETILVILRPGQAPQNPTQIIQKVRVITDVSITFEDDDDDDGCSNKPGSAGMPYPMDKRTECEKKFYDYCKKIGFGSSSRCENQYELFHDDDCFGFNNSKECDEWYIDGKEKFCEKYPNHKQCAKDELPICGEGGYEPGELCRDDGDEDEVRCPDGNIIIPSTGEECPDDRDICIDIYPPPPECGGQEDDGFLPNPSEDPIYPDEEVEEENDSEESDNESEETDDDGSNGDGSNADNGDSSDGEVFASD